MKTEREKMLAGELYDAFDPELVKARDEARSLFQRLNTSREYEPDERRSLLRSLFGSGGDTVMVQPPFFCCLLYTSRCV